MSLLLCVAEHKADRDADVAHRRRSAAIAPATGPAKVTRHAEEPAACLELVRGQRHLCTAAIYAARLELQSREMPMVGEPPEQLKERATTIPRASNSGTQWIGTPVDARTTAAAPRVQQTTLLRRMMLGCRWRVSGPLRVETVPLAARRVSGTHGKSAVGPRCGAELGNCGQWRLCTVCSSERGPKIGL